LDAVKRASERSAIAVHGEMVRGLNSLATVSSVAPFIGLFSTLIGIVNSFDAPMPGERWAAFALFTKNLSESLMPTALGLVVALLAFCCYKHLLAQVDNFDREMENASLQLLNELGSTNI